MSAVLSFFDSSLNYGGLRVNLTVFDDMMMFPLNAVALITNCIF